MREQSVRILVAGFGPFPGAAVNPSATLACAIARLRRPALAQAVIRAHVFKTSYHTVMRDLDALTASFHPDLVLLFGVAPRARRLRIETQARNLVALLPDAARHAPAQRRIADGPSAIPVSRGLPVRLLKAARQCGLRAGLSRDAGRYVCNFTLWHALAAAQRANGPRLVAFVHIPPAVPLARRFASRHPRRPSFARTVFAAQAMLCAMLAAFGRAD